MSHKRWVSIARCAEGILSNVAVIGIGLALYQKEWWPASAIGIATALLAFFIAWKVTYD